MQQEKNGTPGVSFPIPEGARHILDVLGGAGYEAFVVGGCVRDSLMGRVPHDWDITTSARPEQVKALFRRTVDTGLAHGTVTVMDGKEGYEVTTYRVDGKYEDGRHPSGVTFTASLREDLLRRDFTMNAMAYNQEKGLQDPFGGLSDIQNKTIRCVGDPVQRFSEDALRLLRAVRFSAQLGFDIEERTREAIKQLSPSLSRISAERIASELEKILLSPHPEDMQKAWELGLTKVFLPEFDVCMATPQNTPYHCYSVGGHILQTLRYIRRDKVLRFTMLLHDIAKPECRITDERGIDHFYTHDIKGAEKAQEILRRLKMDNETINQVTALIRWHDYRPLPQMAAVRKAVSRIGEELFPLYLEVQRADCLAQSDYIRRETLDRIAGVEKCFHAIQEEGQCVSLKTLAVSGKDLIAAGFPPGKELGAALEYLLSKVIEEPSKNSREQLLELLKELPGNKSGQKSPLSGEIA